MTKLLHRLDAIKDLDKKLAQIDPSLSQAERTGTLGCLLTNFRGNMRAINVYMTAALKDIEGKHDGTTEKYQGSTTKRIPLR